MRVGQVLVVFVLHGEGNQLRRDRAELDGLDRQPLSGFEELRELHFAAAHRTCQRRHHTRFQVIVQDVSARKRDTSRACFRELGVPRLESRHVVRWIARPALPAYILIEPAVAVGHDVQPRHLLIPEIHR